MSREEILEQLKEILLFADPTKGQLIQESDESTRLVEDFGLSSVNILYVVIYVEENFNIQFDNVGVTDFVTLGDVISYIEEKLQ